MRIDERIMNDAVYVGNYLKLHLAKEEALIFGDHTVISYKEHELPLERLVKGNVRVLTKRDAGNVYYKCKEPNQVLHIDVFHAVVDTEIRLEELLRRLLQALDSFFFLDDRKYQYVEEERYKAVLEFCRKVYLGCRSGQGSLYDLVQGKVTPIDPTDHGYNHIHLLIDFASHEYTLVYILAIAVENFLISQGVPLGKVKALEFHRDIPNKAGWGTKIHLPWRKMSHSAGQAVVLENMNNFLLKLAEQMGGIEEVEKFFGDLENTNWFKKSSSTFENKREMVEAFAEIGLVKKNLFGVRLTGTGKRMRKHLKSRHCELRMQLRRNIRRTPASASRNTQGPMKKGNSRSRGTKITDYNRTILHADADWNGNLAASQTIIQAKKNGFLRKDKKLTIQRQDMHSYAYRTYIPVNICLVLDMSSSMKGEKEYAVEYLAHYLLLSSKDRVAVVVFQDQSARIVVPFTRQEHVLRKGFQTIQPAGLTPMAHGLDKAREAIKKAKIKKPLVVLLTDGLPNVGLWTHEPREDTLTAAEKLKEMKVNFICIGIESNEEFLKEVCDRAGGNFYITGDFARDDLIKIVNYEKKILQRPESRMIRP